MLSAMGRISSGSQPGTPPTHSIEFCQRHRADFVQRYAHASVSRLRAQTGAAALRADILPQELFHPLHALFIRDLGQGVFHGIHGIVVGKIQFPRLVGGLGMIQDMLFFRRTVIHNLLLLLRQFPERHIGAHAHFPADIRHQRPHQAVPRSHRSLFNGQGLVRHQGVHVHGTHGPRAAAPAASTLTVEGQFLSRRGIEMLPAFTAHDLGGPPPHPASAHACARWGIRAQPGANT